MDSSKTLREALSEIAALEPETMLSTSTDRYSGERSSYRTLDYEQVQGIVTSALQQPAEPMAWGYSEVLPGRHERTVWRVTASADQAEMLREAGIEIHPLGLIQGAPIPEPATTDVEREEIARVIEPGAWAILDRCDGDASHPYLDQKVVTRGKLEASLAKADQIKALFASKRVPL